jgi:2-oxoglutarate dehydrogenase E1 component
VPAPVLPASLQKAMTYRKASREDVALPVETGVPAKTLKAIGKALTTVPQGFTPNPKLARLLDSRGKMLDGKGNVDWGFGELLAIGSLALEGHHVRLTGQDSQRGTFTSRHAVFTDFETNQRYESLNHLGGKQASVHVVNSPLSEQGCLGFEFGYSVADPESLVAWEGQFGDFANGAQIIIDQFLSASEAKWRQTSGLVLLLPHGYEGQGPEHSSARPERFLQLCGNLNLQVVYPTTPAQHFHALRRQLHREFRKPLVVMTPKSLLREPLCVSPAESFEKDRFHEILDDENPRRKTAERAIFCSGKIYYDLIKARAENDQYADVPIVRLEQPYPFPYAQMQALLETSYPKLQEIVWTQEEPQNMGGWNFVRGRLLEVLRPHQKLTYVGRKNSGTPAEGSGKAHEAEQRRIIQDALARTAGVVTAKAGAAATGK